jgi:hypothetical protein
MADVTARKTLATKTRSGRSAYPIADGVTLFEGALVGLEAGYLNHWDDGAADVFVGIVLGDALGVSPGAALTGDTSASPVPEARVDDSGVTLLGLDSVAGTPTAAKVGDVVYCTTSNTDDLTLTAGALNHPVGFMSAFRSATDVDVTLFTTAEHLAQATA